MNAKTKLDITSVNGIKDGINQLFSLIDQHLDAYLQNPNASAQVDLCRNYIHQLNGLLEMLELDSVTLIGQKTEKLTEALIQNEIKPEPHILNALKKTIHALQRYLNELIEGAKDNPLCLFPVYRDLMQALGLESVPESDLFFPNLVAEPPLQTAQSHLDSSETQTSAKQARTEYQAGLLKWLRDTSNKDGLQKMVDATSLVEKFPGSMEQRLFWWIATGFLDSLIRQDSNIDLPTRRLCGKIDQEIRRLAEGAPISTTQLMHKMLFEIARSASTSERTREIKHAYEWPEQFNSSDGQIDTPFAVTEILQPTLEELRSTLKDTNQNWQEFSSGRRDALVLLLANFARLKQLATLVQYVPLEKLVAVMHGTVAYLRIRPHDMSEDLGVEMATALLLIENTLDDFGKLPSKLPSQVERITTRLRTITTGKQHDKKLPDVLGPSEVEYKTQEKKLQSQTSHGILANLGQIEAVLDRFFLNTTIRTELLTLAPLFKQTSGVLVMLGLQRADTLLNLCYTLIEKFLNPGNEIKLAEQTLLVDGLSSLGFFVESLNNVQPDRDNIIEAAISLFEQIVGTEVEPAASTSAPTILDTISTLSLEKEAADTETEPELLSIFLQEADEILANITNSLQNCRNNPRNIESITALRREFHTLKGSGRMVELHDMSEVAWSMEQVLNRWISEGKTASYELIELAARTHNEFNQWCDNLKKFGTTEVDADELLQSINSLIGDTAPDISIDAQTVSADEETAAPASTDMDTTAETDAKNDIIIGNTTISFNLFEIFTAESSQHITALENELKNLISKPDTTVSHPFMRASHTLASISRTVGLTFIADLGFALEQWLSQLTESAVRPDDAGLKLLQNTIELLGNLLQAAHNQQMPAATDLRTSETLTQTLKQYLGQADQLAEVEIASQKVPLSDAPSVSEETIPYQVTQSTVDDKIDFELLPLFIEEAHELIPQIGNKLRAWRILPDDSDIHKALLRLLHTFKGGALTAGAAQIGEQIHNMESNVERVSNVQTVSVPQIEKLEHEFDDICKQIEYLQNLPQTETQPETAAQAELGISTDVSVTPLPFQAVGKVETPLALPEDTDADTHTRKTILRVNAELIDQLVNETGETSIIRSKIEAQLYNFKQSLLDLTDSVDRLQGQLREVEIQAETQMQSHLSQTQEGEQPFDPLEFDRFTRFQELTRLMAESVDDVVTVQKSLRATHSAAEESVTQQALMNRKLQQALMQIRTISFGNFAEHYYRLVRQVAKATGKNASLNIQGDEVEIDRSILEKINSPLEHLLRNAVAHGIEEPGKRTQSQKSETGQVTIHIRQEGNEIIITLQDDGSGLDIPRIRDEALRLGLIQENEVLDTHQIMSFIYTHGLSTMEEVTGVAGRGIGMDIVKNEISALGGRVEVSSEAGQGTTFNIFLPLTLAVAQTLLIRVGTQTYAVPSIIVEHIQEFNAEIMNAAYQKHRVDFDGKTYPFSHLSHLLGELDHTPEIKRHNRLLLLHSGTLRLAIHVDELIGNSEVVVKNIGPQLTHAPGVEGATVMGDGGVILILNPVKLLKRDDAQKIFTASAESAKPAQNLSAFTPAIMVVDDSLTVRKVTGRLLEREGCEVLVAKDGLGAIELLREVIPDVILVDLEMPRMNGFELIRNIRMNPYTENIPIIIISSRTAEKHRKMADELGVNVFLGKPYKEEELLNHINQYLNDKRQNTKVS